MFFIKLIEARCQYMAFFWFIKNRWFFKRK